jgi:hypothetical protein
VTPLGPTRVDVRPFAAMRFAVGLVCACLSLVVNAVIFMVVIFSELNMALWIGLTALAIEDVLIPIAGLWAGRARQSAPRNALLAGCVGTAIGPIPFVVWLTVTEVAAH